MTLKEAVGLGEDRGFRQKWMDFGDADTQKGPINRHDWVLMPGVSSNGGILPKDAVRKSSVLRVTEIKPLHDSGRSTSEDLRPRAEGALVLELVGSAS